MIQLNWQEWKELRILWFQLLFWNIGWENLWILLSQMRYNILWYVYNFCDFLLLFELFFLVLCFLFFFLFILFDYSLTLLTSDAIQHAQDEKEVLSILEKVDPLHQKVIHFLIAFLQVFFLLLFFSFLFFLLPSF